VARELAGQSAGEQRESGAELAVRAVQAPARGLLDVRQPGGHRAVVQVQRGGGLAQRAGAAERLQGGDIERAGASGGECVQGGDIRVGAQPLRRNLGEQEWLKIPQKYIVNPELLDDPPAAAGEESSSRFKPKRKRATTATSTAPKQKKKP